MVFKATSERDFSNEPAFSCVPRAGGLGTFWDENKRVAIETPKCHHPIFSYLRAPLDFRGRGGIATTDERTKIDSDAALYI